jgi:hypothetical protein
MAICQRLDGSCLTGACGGSATVKVDEDSNWLSNPDQFAVVVRKALDALGRP